MSEKIVVITTMKNEGPYMLEWVAFHKSLGVDQFLIFTNDCDDGTDRIAQRLEEIGWGHHVYNEVEEGVSPQPRMLARARTHPAIQGADWLICMDVDEFWNIRTGGGTFPDLIEGVERKAGGPVDAISFAWKLFGTSGNVVFNGQPVTRTFTLSDEKDAYHSGRAAGLKTLFRNNGKFTRYGPHRPKGIKPEDMAAIRWSDAGGNLFPANDVGWKAWDGFQHTFGRLHHYSVRALEGFLVKRDRGRTNHVATDQAEQYWLDMNVNKAVDLTIFASADRADPVLRELLSDPVLFDLHHQACRWHEDKIAEIKSRKEWRGFHDWLQQNLLGDLSGRQTAPRAEDPQPEAAGAAEQPEIDLAAPWLAELSPGGTGRGFLHKLEHYAIHHSERPSPQLVISFDNLGEVNNTKLSRQSWGWKFFGDEGYGHIGIFSRRKSWYRDPEIIDYLGELAESQTVGGYESVALVGTSMGAFASLAFSPLFPGANIVAFNPQVTLNPALVPWEERYGFGMRKNWDLPFGDGRVATEAANRAYIFYDPFLEPDRRHAEMLSGDNIVFLKTWFGNHYCAPMLRKLDLLKPAIRAGISGDLEAIDFYRSFRARRKLPWYFRGLSERAERTGHDALIPRAQQRFKKLRRAQKNSHRGQSADLAAE